MVVVLCCLVLCVRGDLAWTDITYIYFFLYIKKNVSGNIIKVIEEGLFRKEMCACSFFPFVKKKEKEKASVDLVC